MDENELFARLSQDENLIKAQYSRELRDLLTEKLSLRDDELFVKYKINKHEITNIISKFFAGGCQNYNEQKRYECYLELKNLLIKRGVLSMNLSFVLEPIVEALDEFEKRLRLKEAN